MYHCKVLSSFLERPTGFPQQQENLEKTPAMICLISHTWMCCESHHIYRNIIYRNSLIQYGQLDNEHVSTLTLQEKSEKAKFQKKNPEYYIIISSVITAKNYLTCIM